MSDRRAVLLLVALGVAGALARLPGHSTGAPGSVAYRAPRSAPSSLDSVAARASRLARSLRRGEKIDLDAASREEIERLPRVGPGLAARIVSDREENGPFGSLGGLDRVSGVGPTVLKAVTPYATFSGSAVPSSRPPASPVSLNTASAEELAKLPGVGPARAQAIVDDRTRKGPFGKLGDLTRVPGIGPAMVKRLQGHVQVP